MVDYLDFELETKKPDGSFEYVKHTIPIRVSFKTIKRYSKSLNLDELTEMDFSAYEKMVYAAYLEGCAREHITPVFDASVMDDVLDYGDNVSKFLAIWQKGMTTMMKGNQEETKKKNQ